MNDLIFQMVKGYLDAFDTYQVSNPSLRQEVDDFKQKLLGFANSQSDISAFYSKFTESGLMEEYSALISRVAMASMSADSAAGEGGSKPGPGDGDAQAPPVVSVHEFVGQYRASYDEVKKAGYRKRAEAAYEAIFDVANKTADMLEAQIILEEEQLLWKIVSEDSLDIFEPILLAMDPMQEAQTVTVEKQIEAYKISQGAEELDYTLEKMEFEKIACISRAVSRMTLANNLAALIMGYCADKMNVWHNGGQGQAGQAALRALIAFRTATRRALKFLQEEFGMAFDDLLENEALKIHLLVPVAADELGRIKTSMNPHNYEVFREAAREGVGDGLPLLEILKQEGEVMWPGFDVGPQHDAFQEKAKNRATQLNAHLTYYLYREQIAAASVKKKEDVSI